MSQHFYHHACAAAVVFSKSDINTQRWSQVLPHLRLLHYRTLIATMSLASNRISKVAIVGVCFPLLYACSPGS